MKKNKQSKSSSEMTTEQQKLGSKEEKSLHVGCKVQIVDDKYKDKDWIGRVGFVRRIIRDGTVENAEFLQELGFKDLMIFVSIVRFQNKKQIRCLMPFRKQDLSVL